jgi:hypothetical protein
MSNDEQRSTDLPAPRIARREGYRPLALTAALVLALVAAWQAFAAPRLAEPVYHPARFDGTVYWVAPGIGPFYAHGDVERADVVVVGDSRAYDDIELETLATEGLGRVARVWGPNADLADLLPSIVEARPEAVLIVASPSLFGADYDPLMTVLLQRPPPELDRLSLENGLRRWRDEERARLLAGGPPVGDPARVLFEQKVDGLVDVWAKRLSDTVRRDGWSTKEIDRVLNEWVDHKRALALATFTTQKWHQQWGERIDIDKLAPHTTMMLRTRNAEQRATTRARFVDAARALQAAGIRLAAVRAPVSPSVLAAEREFVSDEDLRALFTELDVPYFEHHELGLAVRDGSHLTWRASREYTRLVAGLLRELGW